jgi:hypothetical protein
MTIYRVCGVYGVIVVAGVGLGDASSPGAIPDYFSPVADLDTAGGEIPLHIPYSALFYVTRFTFHVELRNLGVTSRPQVLRG